MIKFGRLAKFKKYPKFYTLNFDRFGDDDFSTMLKMKEYGIIWLWWYLKLEVTKNVNQL